MKLLANYYRMFAFMIILNFISFTTILLTNTINKSYLNNKLYSKFNSNNKSKKLLIKKFYPKSELVDIAESFAENFPKDKIINHKKTEIIQKLDNNNNKPNNLINNTNKNHNAVIDSLNESYETSKANSNSMENSILNLNKRLNIKDFDLESFGNSFISNDAEGKYKLKDFSNKDYQLNIYNNFLITNSTITQMLDNFVSGKKTLPKSDGINRLTADELLFSENDWNSVENIKKEYSDKLKALRLQEDLESKSLKEKYAKMLKELQDKNLNNLESIKEYKEKLKILSEKKEEEKDNLNKIYQDKIDELKSKNKLTIEELQRKELELKILKKQNENEYLLLKNKEQQIKELKSLINKNKLKRKALEEKNRAFKEKDEKDEKDIKEEKEIIIDKMKFNKQENSIQKNNHKSKKAIFNNSSEIEKDFKVNKTFNMKKNITQNFKLDEKILQSDKSKINFTNIQNYHSGNNFYKLINNNSQKHVEKNDLIAHKKKNRTKLVTLKNNTTSKYKVNNTKNNGENKTLKSINKTEKIESNILKEKLNIKNYNNDNNITNTKIIKRFLDDKELFLHKYNNTLNISLNNINKSSKIYQSEINKKVNNQINSNNANLKNDNITNSSPKSDEKNSNFSIENEIEYVEDVITKKNVKIKIKDDEKIDETNKMQIPKFFSEQTNLIKKQIKAEENGSQSIKNLAVSGKISIGNNDNLLYKKLYCLDSTHIDSKHFLLSNQKCKQLNYLYSILKSSFHILEQKIGGFECNTLVNCKFDLVINLNDDNTIFVVYKKKHKIMQGLFNPSIFHIRKFELNNLRPDMLKDLISIYIYPSIARLLNLLPQETFSSFSVYIESNVFNGYDKVLKSKILEGILNINKIDSRISIDYNMIDYNSSPINNNELLFTNNADKLPINLRDGYHLQMKTPRSNNPQNSLNSDSNEQVFLEGSFSNNNYDNNINKYPYNRNDKTINPSNYYLNSNENLDFQGLNANSDIDQLLEKGENVNDYFNHNNYGKNTQNYLKKNFRNNQYLNNNNNNNNDNFNKINYPYQFQNYLYNSNPYLNVNNNINLDDLKSFDNNNNNIEDLKSSLENTGHYGENLAKGFFDENHLNFFQDFRFKQKMKETEKVKEKAKEKQKEKSKKQILKEKLKATLQDKQMRDHPCFNKGYYNKNMNFTGTGNFTDCCKVIEKLTLKDDWEKANLKINKNKNRNFTVNLFKNESYNSNYNNDNHNINKNSFYSKNNYVYLDNQFKNFKFLFYEKNGTENLLVFKEQMQYGILKQKVKDICEKQYSNIVAELTKFNIKNLSNLCFDLTYLIKLLDKAKIGDNKIILMKTHLNVLKLSDASGHSIQLTYISKLFDSSYQRNLLFLMLILTILYLLIKTFDCQISEFLLEKIFGTNEENVAKNLIFDEFTINKFMTFDNVKAHLFYKENSYFKQKYGSDFNPDYYDMVLLKHEVLEILKKESDPILKKIIVEKIKNSNENKVIILMKLLAAALLIGMFVCYLLLFSCLKNEIGLLKSLIALSLPLSMLILISFILRFVLTNKIKNEIRSENNNNYMFDKTHNKDDESLIVVAKQTLK